MKKLFNEPADVVADALRGIETAHGDEVLRLWDAPVNTPGLRWGA